MNLGRISVKRTFLLICGGMVASMLAVCAVLFAMTGEVWVLTAGILLTVCAIIWQFLLMQFFGKRLSVFTRELCQVMDRMISGSEEPVRVTDSETLFARISYRLTRLYSIMQENRRKVDMERQELQMLVSDISHQVKTPVSNLKMVTDTLLTRPVPEEARREFLQGIRSQTDKLEFLFQALVKTSRLETGAIRLEKKEAPLIDTLAVACSGVVYEAEKKDISVTVDCPDGLRLSHDSKWTAEAIFNLLDNAVKYTSMGGAIRVSATQWEMYVKLESNQASIFRRFDREEEVHEEQGVGIGLYLAREIVTKQGGYMKVTSEVGRGSTFSVFLPSRA